MGFENLKQVQLKKIGNLVFMSFIEDCRIHTYIHMLHSWQRQLPLHLILMRLVFTTKREKVHQKVIFHFVWFIILKLYFMLTSFYSVIFINLLLLKYLQMICIYMQICKYAHMCIYVCTMKVVYKNTLKSVNQFSAIRM